MASFSPASSRSSSPSSDGPVSPSGYCPSSDGSDSSDEVRLLSVSPEPRDHSSPNPGDSARSTSSDRVRSPSSLSDSDDTAASPPSVTFSQDAEPYLRINRDVEARGNLQVVSSDHPIRYVSSDESELEQMSSRSTTPVSDSDISLHDSSDPTSSSEDSPAAVLDPPVRRVLPPRAARALSRVRTRLLIRRDLV